MPTFQDLVEQFKAQDKLDAAARQQAAQASQDSFNKAQNYEDPSVLYAREKAYQDSLNALKPKKSIWELLGLTSPKRDTTKLDTMGTINIPRD